MASRYDDSDADNVVVGYLHRCEISTGTTAKMQFWFPASGKISFDPTWKVSRVTLERR